MKKNKVGTIFVISVLALAGIGITYAGFTDTINLFGTVSTGDVELVIDDYSGTYVWKVFAADDETVITEDPDYSVPPEEGFLVSYAKGRPIQAGDPEGYDAVIEFDNIFPCIDFTADVVFHYEGTIPVKISSITWEWTGDEVEVPGNDNVDFISWLMANGHMTGDFYRCNENGELFDPLEEVDVGYQLHNCYYFKLIVTIHLPQENWLQGLAGSGYVKIDVKQWNDQCEEDEIEPPVPDQSLVGHWKLDDGDGNIATDSSGNENHGTLMPASPVWTTEGIINGALDFDGVDDYVEIPDDPSLDITNEITLMAWVYAESWDDDTGYPVDGDNAENGILTKGGDSDWGVWNLHYKTTSNGFRFELITSDNNGHTVFETTPSTTLDTWYHIAGVYDGTEMKLYINGVMDNFAAVTGDIKTNDAPLRIGKQFYWATAYSYWDGKIDEVKIYDRALTSTEIHDEYCQGNPTATITINNPGPQYDNTQYGYDFDYSSADVKFTYYCEDTNLRGTIEATGLKPYCTYQVKLIGIPTCLDSSGDDMANEYIGYKGRWTCTSCACTGAACNRNDAQYLANSPFRGSGSECIAGYLVFDFFTVDENGDATKYIEAETSYRVLFPGGGTCNSNTYTYLYYPDAAHPTLAFCPPDKVNGQPEGGRGGCGGLSLDADTYHCTIALTEESFHQGNWATVLEGLIDFKIV
jgi:hypothetical protein